jgi:hypothetical protein
MNSVILRSCDGFRIIKDSQTPFYSFQFVTEGSCEVSGAFGSVTAHPGDVFVIDPNDLTREIWSDDCRQFVIRIERDVVAGSNATSSRRPWRRNWARSWTAPWFSTRSCAIPA